MLLILPNLVIGQKLELITPPILDLGEIPADTVVEGTIQFKNSGERPLKILRVQTSCGCTAAELTKLDYAPGANGELKVFFNTKGYSGLVRKSITFYLENGSPSRVQVRLQATVKPKIEFNPMFIDFQNISLVDSQVVRYLKVENNTEEPMVIEMIKNSIKNLTIVPGKIVIQPGEMITVTLTFVPKTTGRQDGYVDFQVEKPFKSKKRIPVFIKVKS